MNKSERGLLLEYLNREASQDEQLALAEAIGGIGEIDRRIDAAWDGLAAALLVEADGSAEESAFANACDVLALGDNGANTVTLMMYGDRWRARHLELQQTYDANTKEGAIVGLVETTVAYAEQLPEASTDAIGEQVKQHQSYLATHGGLRKWREDLLSSSGELLLGRALQTPTEQIGRFAGAAAVVGVFGKRLGALRGNVEALWEDVVLEILRPPSSGLSLAAAGRLKSSGDRSHHAAGRYELRGQNAQYRLRFTAAEDTVTISLAEDAPTSIQVGVTDPEGKMITEEHLEVEPGQSGSIGLPRPGAPYVIFISEH